MATEYKYYTYERYNNYKSPFDGLLMLEDVLQVFKLSAGGHPAMTETLKAIYPRL